MNTAPGPLCRPRRRSFTLSARARRHLRRLRRLAELLVGVAALLGVVALYVEYQLYREGTHWTTPSGDALTVEELPDQYYWNGKLATCENAGLKKTDKWIYCRAKGQWEEAARWDGQAWLDPQGKPAAFRLESHRYRLAGEVGTCQEGLLGAKTALYCQDGKGVYRLRGLAPAPTSK